MPLRLTRDVPTGENDPKAELLYHLRIAHGYSVLNQDGDDGGNDEPIDAWMKDGPIEWLLERHEEDHAEYPGGGGNGTKHAHMPDAILALIHREAV